MLHGRATECAHIEDLITGARQGVAGALVLRGDPGLGKTALLHHAVALGSDLLVLHVTGVADDVPAAFGALRTLLGPVLDHLGELPEDQADVLGAALGMRDAPGAGRFAVGAALVGLLAGVAEHRPLLCVVDDAQWVDADSLQVLAFAGQRLEADRVAVLVAVEDLRTDVGAFPEVWVRPLDPAAAAAVVRDHATSTLDEVTVERLVLAAQGNALALVELAAETGTCGEAGSVSEQEPAGLPVGSILQRIVLRRVAELGVETQRLLLLTAAEGTGDPGLLTEVAQDLGLDPARLADAERSGLLRSDGTRLVFSHPLTRSAVHRSATAADRRIAHGALAAAFDRRGDRARWAWHRATAAVAGDDVDADALERSAWAAGGRGAHAVTAVLLERAAALAGSPDRTAQLLFAAAEEAWQGGRLRDAARLVGRVRVGTSDPLLRGRADHLHGRLDVRRGATVPGYESLLDGAQRVDGTAAVLATTMLVDAVDAAWAAGDVRRASEAARRAAELDRPATGPNGAEGTGSGRVDLELALAVASLTGASTATADGDLATIVARLRTAVGRAGAQGPEDGPLLRRAAAAALLIGDDDTARELAVRVVERARAAGCWEELARGLEVLAAGEFRRSPPAARVHADEGLRVATEGDVPGSVAVHHALLALVAAVRGDEDDVRHHTEGFGPASCGRRRHGVAEALAGSALALLDLGAGRFEAALARFEGLADAGAHPAVVRSNIPDLVEAAVQAGRPERAAAPLARFEAWAGAVGSGRTTAVLTRCRALLAEGAGAADLYAQALARHGEASVTVDFDAARTGLLLGEHLRRERHRVEGRPHLLAALDAFEQLEAHPWAERARAELRAAGGTVPARREDAVPLTPAQRRIADLVAAGLTTREIAVRLAMSPRTVEHHRGRLPTTTA